MIAIARLPMALLFSCASIFCLLLTLYYIKSTSTSKNLQRASWSSSESFQGFRLDRQNILFDGRGEFDYLRGEPPADVEQHDEKVFHPTTDDAIDNAIWEINATKRDVEIASGTIHYQYTNINNVETDNSLSYLHCNTRDSFSNELKAQALHGWLSPPPNLQTHFQKERLKEILLLQEARQPSTEWRESGILHQLCIDGFRAVLQYEKDNDVSEQQQPYVSVTAVDLDPNASGFDLNHAIRNLEKNSILSGRPLIVVSPVESGKTVISLGAYASEVVPEAPEEEEDRQWSQDEATRKLRDVSSHLPNHYNSNEKRQLRTVSDTYHPGAMLLTHMVKTWISIAPIDALESSAEALRAFLLANVECISIYNMHDVWGKRAAERLETTAGAQTVGMNDNYLRNPQKFVEIISSLLY